MIALRRIGDLTTTRDMWLLSIKLNWIVAGTDRGLDPRGILSFFSSICFFILFFFYSFLRSKVLFLLRRLSCDNRLKTLRNEKE